MVWPLNPGSNVDLTTQELVNSISRMPNLESLTLCRSYWRPDDNGRGRRDSDPEECAVEVFRALAQMPALRSLSVPSTWSLDGVWKLTQLRALSVEFNSGLVPLSAAHVRSLTQLQSLSGVDYTLSDSWREPALCPSSLTSLTIRLRFADLGRLCSLRAWATLLHLDLHLVEPPPAAEMGPVEAWAKSVADRRDLQLCLRVPDPFALKPFLALGNHKLVRQVHLLDSYDGDKSGKLVVAVQEALNFERLHIDSGSGWALLAVGELLQYRPHCALRFVRHFLPSSQKAATSKLQLLTVHYERDLTDPDAPPAPDPAKVPARTIEFVVQREMGRYDLVSCVESPVGLCARGPSLLTVLRCRRAPGEVPFGGSAGARFRVAPSAACGRVVDRSRGGALQRWRLPAVQLT